MELFLLYAMGLTIVAFFSIVMASPKVLPVAQHGSDNDPEVLKPNQSTNSFNETEQQEAIQNQEVPSEAANASSSTGSIDDLDKGNLPA